MVFDAPKQARIHFFRFLAFSYNDAFDVIFFSSLIRIYIHLFRVTCVSFGRHAFIIY